MSSGLRARILDHGTVGHVCEGCGFYETGVESIDILRRQRDDATSHADAARARLYDELVAVIDASA